MHTQPEAETAIRQREWLLQDTLPPLFERLRSLLEKSLDILTKASKADQLPLSTSQNESIKGFVALNGTHINKAEIQVKLANYHSDTPIKATIRADAPYFLEQAQQGKNYIVLAAQRIDAFRKPFTKQGAVEVLEDMNRYMDRAMHAFDYPNEAAMFPYKYFNPPLKQDLVIEFCIQDVFIVCNVFALDYRVARHTGHKFGSQDHHTHVLYKDKAATVLCEAKTQTQSPMLTELKASLSLIRGLCHTHQQMLLQVEA